MNELPSGDEDSLPPSLPESVSSDDDGMQCLPGHNRCCEHECLDLIDSIHNVKRRVDEIKQAVREERDREKRRDLQCLILKNLATSQASGAHRRHRVEDVSLCREAVCHIIQLSRKNFTEWSKWIEQGHNVAPKDLRLGSSAGPNPRAQSQAVINADVMWAWIHKFFCRAFG